MPHIEDSRDAKERLMDYVDKGETRKAAALVKVVTHLGECWLWDVDFSGAYPLTRSH